MGSGLREKEGAALQLKSKVQILIFVILVMAIIIPLGVTVFLRMKEASAEMREFGEAEYGELKDQVSNYLNLTYETLSSDYLQATHQKYLEKSVGRNLRNNLDIILHFLSSKQSQVKNGSRTLEDAQTNAIKEVSSLRRVNGDGYIWIQTDDLPFPKMVSHPLRPDLVGKVLDDPAFNCARDRADNLFVAAVEVASQSSDGGFLTYLWDHILSDGTKVPNVPKISFVKRFPEWGWVLGNGIFLDDAINFGIETMKSDIAKLKFDNGNGFFWIQDLHGRIIWHPKEEFIGMAVSSSTDLPFVSLGIKMAQEGRKTDFCEANFTSEGFLQKGNRLVGIRLFEPLSWIIGTSVEIDQLKNKIIWKEREVRGNVINLCLFFVVFAFLMLVLSFRMVGRILGELGLYDSENGKGIPGILIKDLSSDQLVEPEVKEKAVSVDLPLKEITQIVREIAGETKKFHEAMLDHEKVSGKNLEAIAQRFPKIQEKIDILTQKLSENKKNE